MVVCPRFWFRAVLIAATGTPMITMRAAMSPSIEKSKAIGQQLISTNADSSEFPYEKAFRGQKET
jgi:hypothetical protein